MELLSAKVKLGRAVGEMSLLINYPDGSHTTLHQKIWTTPLTRLTAQVRKNQATSSRRYTGREWRTVDRLVWMSWISCLQIIAELSILKR